MMDLIVELKATTAGGEHAFEVTAIDTNAATVNGVGLTTNTFRTAKYDVATVSFESLSTGRVYSAGESTNLEFGRFRLSNTTASNEDREVVLKTITLRNEGDGDAATNLQNVKVTQNGVVVSSEVVHEGKYMTVVFKDGYKIAANQTPVFELVADVTFVDNTAGDKYKFIVQRTQDVVAVESVTDFRATVPTATDAVFNLGEVTVKGGDIMLRNAA